jgi:hypothetical protein
MMCIVVILMVDNSVQADVINQSVESVYVKSEEDSTLTEVKSGHVYKGKQDGVVSNGHVIKSSDGVDLIVGKDGGVTIAQSNPLIHFIEIIHAGEITEPPDRNWVPAFEKAKIQISTKENVR